MVSADDSVEACVYIRQPPPPPKKKKKKKKKKKTRKQTKQQTNTCVSGYINFLLGTEGKKYFNFGKKNYMGKQYGRTGKSLKSAKKFRGGDGHKIRHGLTIWNTHFFLF